MNCCCSLLRFLILLLKSSVFEGNDGVIYVSDTTTNRFLNRLYSFDHHSYFVRCQGDLKVNGVLWFTLSDFIPRGLATAAFIRLMASRATSVPAYMHEPKTQISFREQKQRRQSTEAPDVSMQPNTATFHLCAHCKCMPQDFLSDGHMHSRDDQPSADPEERVSEFWDSPDVVTNALNMLARQSE